MSQKIAILGPGLLGASIVQASKRHGPAPVALWARRAAVVDELRARNLADLVSTDLASVVADSAIVVLCVPIGVMPGLARELAPLVGSQTLVTDVGSAKAGVVAELSEIFRGRARFIGSHPMAGSDKTGHAAASAQLFDGRVCILTPDANVAPETIAEATLFWNNLGSSVRLLTPREHDEIVALVSHLPHLLAATLVNTVQAQNPAAFAFHGPGFFDTTRVAAGSPEMWAEILHTNRLAVKASAEAMIEKLREITTLLDRELTMNQFLTQAKALRDGLRPSQ